MARVTVEDCLEQVPNRFALTVLASRRARALSEGKGTAQVESDNKSGVVALREVAKGVVRYTENVEETIKGYIEEQRASLMASSGNEATFIDAASFGDDDDDEDGDDVKELSADPDKLQDDDDDDDDDEDGDSDAGNSDGTVTSSDDDSANLEDVDVDDLESDDLDDDDDD